jgi:hypothetical protein
MALQQNMPPSIQTWVSPSLESRLDLWLCWPKEYGKIDAVPVPGISEDWELILPPSQKPSTWHKEHLPQENYAKEPKSYAEVLGMTYW